MENISSYPDHAIRAGQYFLLESEFNQIDDLNDQDEDRDFDNVRVDFSLSRCCLCKRSPGIYNVFTKLMNTNRTLAMDINLIWSHIRLQPSLYHHVCICKGCFFTVRRLRRLLMSNELSLPENDNNNQ